MNHKYLLLAGSLVATLSMGTSTMAAESAPGTDPEYCPIPYLYATSIRSACEQLGSRGLDTLYSGSRMFDQLLNRPHIADVFPDPDLLRSRS